MSWFQDSISPYQPSWLVDKLDLDIKDVKLEFIEEDEEEHIVLVPKETIDGDTSIIGDKPRE